MRSPEKSGKGGKFLVKGKHATLGDKALGTQPNWKDDGKNTEQTTLPKVFKTVEDDGGSQGHPAKKSQPTRYMRFLPD